MSARSLLTLSTLRIFLTTEYKDKSLERTQNRERRSRGYTFCTGNRLFKVEIFDIPKDGSTSHHNLDVDFGRSESARNAREDFGGHGEHVHMVRSLHKLAIDS